MTSLDRDVRFQAYRHFAETGRAPDPAELAGRVGRPRPEVVEALRRLADAHALVLEPDSPRIRMAHPFSAVETPYPVDADGVSYRANCAWDALGIPALLGVDAESRSVCPDCDEPITLRVRGGEASSDPEGAVIHFLVPARSFWDDIGFT
jgi:hypothetical protein